MIIELNENNIIVNFDSSSGAIISVKTNDLLTDYNKMLSVFYKAIDKAEELGLSYLWAKQNTATYLKLVALMERPTRLFIDNQEIGDIQSFYKQSQSKACDIFDRPCTNPKRDVFKSFIVVCPVKNSKELPFVWLVVERDKVVDVSKVPVLNGVISFHVKEKDLDQYKIRYEKGKVSKQHL